MPALTDGVLWQRFRPAGIEDIERSVVSTRADFHKRERGMEQIVVRPGFFPGLTCDTAIIEMIEFFHGVGHPQDHGDFFLFIRRNGIRQAVEIDIVFAE